MRHFIIFLFALFFTQENLFSHTGGFARMGFASRGMGMGNAISAITNGEVYSYYNPALLPFAKEKNVSVSFSNLSFDRSLSFLSYTQNVKPSAGISIGLINATISNIDGRDNDGRHIKNFSTSENQFFLSFGNRFSKYFSVGTNVKIYYAKLYENITSTTVGFDFGVGIKPHKNFFISLMLQDFSSKYKWNTSSIYNLNGIETIDNFQLIKKIALSYSEENNLYNFAIELQNADKKNLLRSGIEFNMNENFSFRFGIDKIYLNDEYFQNKLKPSFGFSLSEKFDNYKPKLHYAYILENYSLNPIHNLTLEFALSNK